MRLGVIVVGIIVMFFGLLLDLTILGAIIGLPIGFIGFIIFLIGLFTSSKPLNVTVKQVGEDPLSSLKVRYAKGEITKEQFNQMKKDLSEI